MSLRKIGLLFFILAFIIASAESQPVVVNLDSQSNFSHAKILGVKESNGVFEGIAADLTVEVRPGSGRVFIDTLPLTKFDTQASARLAKEVACTTLEKDCSGIDFMYIIRSEYSMVGGPSAGAALTAATMAALQGIDINRDVFITATINPAGSLGSIGGVSEKAGAASKAGAKILIFSSEQEHESSEQKDMIAFIAEQKKNNNLEIILADDIIEAYKHLTGYVLLKPEITSDGTISESLNNVLKQMADGILKNSREEFQTAQSKVRTVPADKKEQLNSMISSAERELENADTSYSKGHYYSASSFGVRSQINAYHARLLVDYYRENEDKDYILNELFSLNESIVAFDILFLRGVTIDSMDDVEVLSVVIDRISEAENILENAQTAFEEEDYELAIYYIAYAEVRKNTAYQWLTLINEFTGDTTHVFDPSIVQPLALERIGQSRESVLYAQFINPGSLVENAMEHLVDAEKAYNEKKYVSAVFESAKARATADLALETRTLTNNTVDQKIEHLEERAILAIQRAENRGLTPILALSYLEFAKTFYDTDPAQALIYLSYSKEMATISYEMSQSAFGDWFNLNLPEPKIERYYQEIVRFNTSQEFAITVVLLITGIFAGILLTMYVLEKK